VLGVRFAHRPDPGRDRADESAGDAGGLEAAATRNDVVVLPSVPVIPTTPRRCDGSPYHQAAASASAAADRSTTSWGSPASGIGWSTIAAAAPAAAAFATNS
jgi:hypothetical protein